MPAKCDTVLITNNAGHYGKISMINDRDEDGRRCGRRMHYVVLNILRLTGAVRPVAEVAAVIRNTTRPGVPVQRITALYFADNANGHYM